MSIDAGGARGEAMSCTNTSHMSPIARYGGTSAFTDS